MCFLEFDITKEKTRPLFSCVQQGEGMKEKRMNIRSVGLVLLAGGGLLAGCASLEERLASDDPIVRRNAEYELVSHARVYGNESDRIAAINRVKDPEVLQQVALQAEPEKEHRNSISPSTLPDGLAAVAKLTDRKSLAMITCGAKAKEIRIAAGKKLTDQAALVAVYRRAIDDEVRNDLIGKMDAESLRKVPYSKDMISCWAKITDQRTLAMIYRDGHSVLSESDRNGLVAKITDEKILSEMVIKPSQKEIEKARRETESKKDELKSQMEEAKRRSNKTQMVKLFQEIKALNAADAKFLYVSDAKAKAALYGKIGDPETLVAVFGKKDVVDGVEKSDRRVLDTAYGGETIDMNQNAARKYLEQVKNQKALVALAHGAELFSIRAAAIERLEDEDVLAEIAKGRIKDCPYDTSRPGCNPFVNGIDWIRRTENASKLNLQELAIARMKDANRLKSVRKECRGENVKKLVTARLAELGQSDVAEICACEKYDADLFAMMEELKAKDDRQKVSQTAKLKGIRLLAASKLEAAEFAEVAKKEFDPGAVKPVEGKMCVGGYFLGMNIEDVFAKLAAEEPAVKPMLYLDDKVLCIADGTGRDIAWASVETLAVHWLTLPPSVVKKLAGFKTGTFEDLESAVSRKLGVSFGYDVIRKGDVCQKIGNLENTEGETLRYFKSGIGEGEDIRRSFRKAANQLVMDTTPANGGIGAALMNAFEDARQVDENRANARSPIFQPQGSLQLLFTESAVKGSLGTKGSFTKSASLGEALKAGGELMQTIGEIKAAKKEVSDAWAGLKGEIKKGMDESMGDEGKAKLRESMDALKSAADALKNLGN